MFSVTNSVSTKEAKHIKADDDLAPLYLKKKYIAIQIYSAAIARILNDDKQ